MVISTITQTEDVDFSKSRGLLSATSKLFVNVTSIGSPFQRYGEVPRFIGEELGGALAFSSMINIDSTYSPILTLKIICSSNAFDKGNLFQSTMLKQLPLFCNASASACVQHHIIKTASRKHAADSAESFWQDLNFQDQLTGSV